MFKAVKYYLNKRKLNRLMKLNDYLSATRFLSEMARSRGLPFDLLDALQPVCYAGCVINMFSLCLNCHKKGEYKKLYAGTRILNTFIRDNLSALHINEAEFNSFLEYCQSEVKAIPEETLKANEISALIDRITAKCREIFKDDRAASTMTMYVQCNLLVPMSRGAKS